MFWSCKLANVKLGYSTVGEGGFGSVWKVETESKDIYAAKKVSLTKKNAKKEVMKELDILQKLDNSFVIKIVEYFEEPEVVVFVDLLINCQSYIIFNLFRVSLLSQSF